MLADWFVAENAYLALSKLFGGLSKASITGKTFWVDSSDTNSSDASGRGTVTSPFATCDYAVGQCTASRGDVILVKPGHSETFTSSSSVDIDVAGVAVIGLKQGNQRPTLTFQHSSAKIELAAAGCSFDGFECINDIDAQASMVNISASKCVLSDCLFYSTAPASKLPNEVVTVASNPDDVSIVGNRMTFRHDTNEVATACINVSGGCNRLMIIGNQIEAKSPAIIWLDAASACYYVVITDNWLVNVDTNASGIINDESSAVHTGIAARNLGYNGNAAAMATNANIAFNQNYFSSSLALSGTIDPAIA